MVEPLNEPGFDGNGLIVRGKHTLFLGSKAGEGDRWITEKRRDNYLEPLLYFNPPGFELSQFVTLENRVFAGLTRELPWNVNVLTLDTLDGGILLRLENIWSEELETKVDLEGLFQTFEVNSVTELGLAGDRLKSEISPPSFNTGEDEVTFDHQTVNGLIIDLVPMQIATLKLEVTWL